MADLPAAPFRSQSRFARPQVVFLSQPVDHDYAGLVQTGNHTHRTRQFILNKRLKSISFNENNKGQLSDVWLYKEDSRREEKRLSFCVHQVLCIRLCQPCQEACHCSEARQPWCHPPLFMFYSTPSLSWQPSMFSPPQNHDSSLWSPFLHLITSFSPCKVILQVEVGRLGLWTGNWLVRGFSLNPCSPQGLKPEGLLKRCAADVQLLLIQKDCRLGILSAPSSRQRLLCPVNAVRVS